MSIILKLLKQNYNTLIKRVDILSYKFNINGIVLLIISSIVILNNNAVV